MFLRRLRLWNWRKYGSGNNDLDLKKPDLDVPFKLGLNVLIGENDSGKTAIIDAIKIVLKTHSSEWIALDEDDFYLSTTRLRVECEFFDFRVDEAKNFSEWLSWEGKGVDAKPYLRVFIDVRRFDGKIMPFDTKAGLDNEGISLDAGAREYLKTTYLKPLRDAKSELIPRKNSRLSQILQAHPAFRNNVESHDLITQFNRFSEGIANYFEGKAPDGSILSDQLGKELKDEIDRYLDEFSHKTSRFEVSEGDLKQILARLELAFKGEKNLGLGSHNLLFISTELLHLNKKNWHGLRLGLIEEVEAHLHPQIQLQVIESLQRLKSIQLIITTHSPNIGSKIDLENLIICHANDVFPMGKDYTELEETDYRFLQRFLDVTKANLFFARGVVLVEGWAEEILLPSLAMKAGMNLTEKGVSVVNIGSTAFLRYSRIFKRTDNREFKLPVAVITDLDVIPSLENRINNGQKNGVTKTIQKQKKYDGGSVRTFVSPHWTLEYCIALSSSLSAYLFEAIKRAGEEMTADGYTGKKVEEDWNTFASGKPAEAIAEIVYTKYIGDGKQISKSIIAHHLAHMIDELPDGTPSIDTLKQDVNLKYLFDALTYASNDK